MLSRRIALMDPDLRKFVVLRCYRIALQTSQSFFDPKVRITFSQSILPQFKANRGLINKYFKYVKEAEDLASICLNSSDTTDFATRRKGLKNLVKLGYSIKRSEPRSSTSKAHALINIKESKKSKVKHIKPEEIEQILSRARKSQDPLIIEVYESLFSPSNPKVQRAEVAKKDTETQSAP